jgi:general nucleoside transport system permease protein
VSDIAQATPTDPAADAGQTPPKPPGGFFRAIDRLRVANTVVVTVLAFLVALVVGAILIAVTNTAVINASKYFFQHPADTFSAAWQAISSAYSALFEGAIINPSAIGSGNFSAIFGPLSETMVNATPLILVGLSVGLAFRAGLFNIGGQGQIILGACASGFVAFHYHMPMILHLIVAIVAGVVAGGLWGGLAGWLKARRGAHEVITTIMLNYIAYYFLVFLLGETFFKRPGSNQAISPLVDGNSRLPHLLGANLRVNAGLLLALAAAAGVSWLLKRSKLGFELRAVGANQAAARTAGMDVGGTTIKVMFIAGALSGLAGVTQVLGTATGYSITTDVDAGAGFNGITVALLGRANPWGTVLAGLLFGALTAGGITMQAQTGTSVDLVLVLQATIVLFIAAPNLIIAMFRLRPTGSSFSQQLAKGWNG